MKCLPRRIAPAADTVANPKIGKAAADMAVVMDTGKRMATAAADAAATMGTDTAVHAVAGTATSKTASGGGLTTRLTKNLAACTISEFDLHLRKTYIVFAS